MPLDTGGATGQGLQLSIRLQKQVFTNGEPVLACITLRNTSEKVRYFVVGPGNEELDTRITLMRGEERILGVDDPKPGESFRERLSHIRSGSALSEPVSPGTQRQFFRDLSKMFDLSVPGTYSAHAERKVIALDKVPDRPGYIGGLSTNLQSGTVNFRMESSHATK